MILIGLCNIPAFAGVIDRENPVVGTQTKPVLVTQEMLENKEKKGAPAPSFKLLDDIARFFVKKPVEGEVRKAETKKPKSSLFSDETEYNTSVT